jgi:hypothetical protein
MKTVAQCNRGPRCHAQGPSVLADSWQGPRLAGGWRCRCRGSIAGERRCRMRTAKRRKHNPTILRYKRAARALGLAWRDVTAERDRLRAHERLLREDDDTIRREAWIMCAGEQAAPWWRGAFQRKFADYCARAAIATRSTTGTSCASNSAPSAPALPSGPAAISSTSFAATIRPCST